ncbi:MAG: ABC transporter substrate-binding protein [Phycisphaerae bacterium]|jgi:simple sugar transport system substrate-binding protein|nr:ABC transporter substrate-binding protein [Phycisphaerae bacterium]
MKNISVWILCCGLTCCTILPSCNKPNNESNAKKITVGFSQIGAESDWRSANTLSIKNEAALRGVDLRFADAQQKQENQIKALRSFIDQKVDVIALAPVVTTGWQGVLAEIKAAGIPVILTDRAVEVSDDSLYITLISPDTVEEGRRAARWFIENTKGELKVFELLGTPGSSPAIDRAKGFREAIVAHPRIRIIKSQTGDFESAKGKEVTQAFLKTPEGGDFNALYAHNDNMAIGAIQALKEAGRKPGADIKIVSIDAVKAAFEAMVAGELNCTVECNPLLGPQLFDTVQAIMAAKALRDLGIKHKLVKPDVLNALGGAIFEKRVWVDEGVFVQSDARKLINTRKY